MGGSRITNTCASVTCHCLTHFSLTSGGDRDRAKRRASWSARALEALTEADLLFMDPDNGLTRRPASQLGAAGAKYVSLEEVVPYYHRGNSLIIYHHQTREKGGLAVTIPEKFALLRSLGCESPWALVFRRMSRSHASILARLSSRFMDTRWGLCRHFELVPSGNITSPSSENEMSGDFRYNTRMLASEPGTEKLPAGREGARSDSLELGAGGSLVPNEQGIKRGIRLFTRLVDLANHGDAVGISYAGFIAYLHGLDEFRQVAGRNYRPSDSIAVVRIALSITQEAGGRREVSRSEAAIPAGMDTFIWNGRSPFDRPERAWLSSNFTIPYTRERWLSIFPNGDRRLITAAELGRLLLAARV
jgi:hypothetical protein